MGSIRENLKVNLGYYLTLRGISQKDFAARLSVSQSSVTNWVKGKNSPDIETVAKICEILDVSVVDLFGLETTSYDDITPAEYEGIKKYRSFSVEEKGAVDALFNYICTLHEAPKMSTVIELPLPMHTASAGYGDWADDDDSAEMVKVALDTTTRKADFLFRVNGDSMDPNIPDGSIVAVRRQGDVPVGKVGLFFSCEDGYFIKVRGRDGLEPYNKKYPTIKPNGDSGIECRGLVLGVVEVVSE